VRVLHRASGKFTGRSAETGLRVRMRSIYSCLCTLDCAVVSSSGRRRTIISNMLDMVELGLQALVE